MKQRAFTLIEMLVVVAIVLILFGAMITATKHLKAESQRRLTASAIAVVETALDQYYQNTTPKQYPPAVFSKNGLNEVLYGTPPSNTVTATIGDVDDPNFVPPKLFWNSGAAYYFLTRVPQSKAILESLSNRMISNRDLNEAAILVTVPPAAAVDFVRFVDAWGTSLKYQYQTGYAFPVITSAGPDRVFGTGDDVVSQ